MPVVTVRVPATSANLGPGFDAFGLALGLYQTFSAEPADSWSVHAHGEGAQRFPRDGRNQVARAMAEVFAIAPGAPKAARLTCDNQIPSSQGLGSSAAAIVGGVMLADALCDARLGKDRLFEIATRIEGHPDNVAAAIYGGFTIAWKDEFGPRSTRIEPATGMAVIAVGSVNPLSTRSARKTLPSEVPHSDAAFNVGRAGLLAAGIALGRADLIDAGSHDRLHEPYRRADVPDVDEVAGALREVGAQGAALSGSGSTVIGLVLDEDDDSAFRRGADVASRLANLPDNRLPPRVLRIDRSGASFIRR